MFAAAGLHRPMLLHVAWLPLLSIGHVVLSPAVQLVMQTVKFDLSKKWQFCDMHWSFDVQLS